MKVSKSKAAKMVGISRSTFYQHIKSKPISIEADGQIDVSELIRVYGSEQLKSPEQIRQSEKAKKGLNQTEPDAQLLKEVDRLNTEIEKLDSAYRQEREQFSEEVEYLRKTLERQIEQNSKLTLLLTDQRNDEADKGQTERENELGQKIAITLKAVQRLQDSQSAKMSFWKRLIG